MGGEPVVECLFPLSMEPTSSSTDTRAEYPARSAGSGAEAALHHFGVYEVCAGTSEIILCNGSGRFHVARVLGNLPRQGDIVYGEEPVLGFAVMLSATGGQVVRVIYRVINCNEWTARTRMAW